MQASHFKLYFLQGSGKQARNAGQCGTSKGHCSPQGWREKEKTKKHAFFFPEAFKKNKSCSSILQNTLKQPNTELFMPVLKHKLYNPELIALGGEYI